jgi:hypothetical protein
MVLAPGMDISSWARERLKRSARLAWMLHEGFVGCAVRTNKSVLHASFMLQAFKSGAHGAPYKRISFEYFY